MRPVLRSLIIGAALVVSASCETPLTVEPPPRSPFSEANATIEWMDLEGGFWAIRGDNGVVYDPHPTIAPEFRQHGLRVKFTGQVRNDLACIHMSGPIVTVTELRRN